MTERKTQNLTIMGIFFMALVLTLMGARLAVPQAPTLAAKRIQAAPFDPYATVWSKADQVQVPLSSPGEGAIRSVTAKALNDGQRVYLMLEWPDATPDMTFAGPQSNFEMNELFRDSVLVEFPAVDAGAAAYFRGRPASKAVGWLWSSQYQTDIQRNTLAFVRQQFPQDFTDFYPMEEDMAFFPARSVGNTNAQTATTEPTITVVLTGNKLHVPPKQTVTGKGVWRNGKWRVVISQPLGETKGPHLAVGTLAPFGLNVSDGGRWERKRLAPQSAPVSLTLSTQSAGAGPSDLLTTEVRR